MLLDARMLISSRLKQDKDPSGILAKLAHALCELDERIRITRMKPSPKSIDVLPAKFRRQKKALGYTEVQGENVTLESPDPDPSPDPL